MSFLVETGAVVIGANSYVPVAYADDYHATHANTGWPAGQPSVSQPLLIYATQWIDEGYDWRGQVSTVDRDRLRWPRIGALDDEARLIQNGEIPTRLMYAVCELALVLVGYKINQTFSRGGYVHRLSAGGSGGNVTIEFEQGAPAGKTWPIVNHFLAGLVWGSPVMGARRMVLA